MIRNKPENYLGIIGALLFVITTIIGGYVFEGYSHVAQYISESYAYGTEYGHLLRWFGYIPSGLLMGLFCFGKAKRFKFQKYIYFGLIGFGIFYGLFTSLVSVFPCDFGCNRDYSDASFSQVMHTILSLLTYALTPVSVFLAGLGFKKIEGFKMFSTISIVLSLLGLLFGSIFILNSNSPIAGLLQRNTETVYLSWLVFLSVFIIQRNKR